MEMRRVLEQEGCDARNLVAYNLSKDGNDFRSKNLKKLNPFGEKLN